MAVNILVVDDSAVARSVIMKTLRLTDLAIGDILQAANGQEGLAVMETQWIDLLFVDINMPVMNGEDMITAVRANPAWANLPIVVISTEGSMTRIGSLMHQGVRFIHKPFTPESIRDVLTELMGVQQ
ncbi:MAG: response regulator [Phycisphaerae bacterium]|nr:response regulator [Phycisphaerae bacterium]